MCVKFTRLCYFMNGNALLLRHKSQHREHDHAGIDGCERINRCNNHRIPTETINEDEKL